MLPHNLKLFRVTLCPQKKSILQPWTPNYLVINRIQAYFSATFISRFINQVFNL